jgi:hypothetical protein
LEGVTFAINHAATAHLLKRGFPEVGLLPLLLPVQAMEVLWVFLNYFVIERTTTEPVVKYVGDIHLGYMPFSHSVVTMLGVGAAAWIGGILVKRARLGAAVGLGVISHLLLDLLTHNGDIVLAPFVGGKGYGTYLCLVLCPLEWMGSTHEV